MVAIGVAYLVFEDTILNDFTAVTAVKSAAAAAAKDPISEALLGAQIGLILLSMWVTRSSALSLQAKLGLPRGNQIVALLIFFVSILVMPLLHRSRPSNNYLYRLMVVFLTFAPTFVILTISYEGLFYVAFSATLFAWVRMEHAVYAESVQSEKSQAAEEPKTTATTTKQQQQPQQKKQSPKKKQDKAAAAAAATKANGANSTNGSAKAVEPSSQSPSTAYRSLTVADARVVLFFFILLQSAFFSASNVASVSSFSLESVQRLVPVFDPFSQGAMLTLKLLVPFALISANLGILNMRLGVAPSSLFMAVMAISDVLTLYFFWVVKDEGSWLEIGSTISHFVIASLLCAFVAGLEGVSALFVSGVEVVNHHAVAAQ